MGLMPEQSHRHHAIDYIELTVTDLNLAKRFYGEAFGWEFNDYGPEYAGIKDPDAGAEVGGLRADADVRAGGPLVLLFPPTWTRAWRPSMQPVVRWSTDRTSSPVVGGSTSTTPAATSSGCGRSASPRFGSPP